MKKDIFISEYEAEIYFFDDTIENALQHAKQTCSALYIDVDAGDYYILTKEQIHYAEGCNGLVHCLCHADFTDCAKEAEPETKNPLKDSAESLLNEIQTFKENQKEPRLCAVYYDNHVFAANLTESEAEKQAEFKAKELQKRVYVLKPDCFFEHAVKRVSIDIFGNESETGYKLDSGDADAPF